MFGGVVDQSNSGGYNVTIDYSAAGIVTEYIQLSCGNRIPIEPTLVAEGRLEWTERIDFGSNCVDQGSISLTRSDAGEWDYLCVQDLLRVVGPLMFECNAQCPTGDTVLPTATPSPRESVVPTTLPTSSPLSFPSTTGGSPTSS